MSESNLNDECERMRLVENTDWSRSLIKQYEEGLAYYRHVVDDNRYHVGRLDTRLGA